MGPKLRKILIVEDDQTLLEVLRYNLVKEGYKWGSGFRDCPTGETRPNHP
jgi:DNA-binding NtrC family response regulator